MHASSTETGNAFAYRASVYSVAQAMACACPRTGTVRQWTFRSQPNKPRWGAVLCQWVFASLAPDVDVLLRRVVAADRSGMPCHASRHPALGNAFGTSAVVYRVAQ